MTGYRKQFVSLTAEGFIGLAEARHLGELLTAIEAGTPVTASTDLMRGFRRQIVASGALSNEQARVFTENLVLRAAGSAATDSAALQKVVRQLSSVAVSKRGTVGGWVAAILSGVAGGGEPGLGCLFPLDADLSAAGATPFPISDTTTDPQVFGFELIRDSSSPDYAMAPSGTLAMFMGDTSSPFFDASEWTSEIVLLGAIRLDNIEALVAGRADFALVFATAGMAESCQIALAVDGGVDNHSVAVRGLGGESVYIQSGIADGSNITTGIYMNTATRQIGAFYNTTDLGYLQYSSMGLGGDPEDLLAPEGDLFVFATGSDSSSSSSPARTVLFGATFSKSQVTGFTGVPAGSVDTCGNAIPAAPALGCLHPFDVDVTPFDSTPFPILVTNTDPQTIGFPFARDSNYATYFAVTQGTFAAFQGDASSPLYDASSFTDEVVLLYGATISFAESAQGTIQVVVGGFDAAARITFGNQGYSGTHYISIAGVSGSTNGNGVMEQLPDNTPTSVVLYMKADTRQLGAVFNGVDLGYLTYEDEGTQPMLAPSGDMWANVQGSDSSWSLEEIGTNLEIQLTFSKSLMGAGLPAGSVDTCGNAA
jgi:hypothetical protein